MPLPFLLSFPPVGKAQVRGVAAARPGDQEKGGSNSAVPAARLYPGG